MQGSRPIRTILVLATSALTLTTAAPANAASASVARGLGIAQDVFSAANPKAEYNALTTSERAAFNAVERVAETRTAVQVAGVGANARTTLRGHAAARFARNAVRGASVAAAYNGCWAMQTSSSARAAAGNTLYTYGQSTQVCATNSRVTRVSVFNVWDETSTPGWRIDKAARTAVFNAGWEGRGLAQYYFVLGIGGWDIQRPTTCLQLRLNGDGRHYASSRSCNLS